MKLIKIFDHRAFKLSTNRDVVRQSIVDILESFSFSCSTKQSMDAVSKVASKLVSSHKRHKKSKDIFRRLELSFLESTVIPELLPLGGGEKEEQRETELEQQV